MGNNKIIGAKIKSIRESKQLSTQEVSERSGLSIEQQMLQPQRKTVLNR